ncbi:AraC family transcriptional regulator [Zestomonas carbonaria]|uniref:HTH-type transcriptional regulator VirS n=1 Tax=Zestomonas carbonaria TaxID=2762745 RepID=A0A7U7ERP6_9GAMM|nr:AraC family transcriptional regulator [Pseudomonas carbonaria]CAD5109943.1 HTH-type transcriptional regulator VirS [Pseudomonas carbonaria]
MTDLARASALHGLAEFAALYDLQAAQLLKDAGLPGDSLERPEHLISYRKFVRLLEIGELRSGNPFFALEFGLHQGVGVFGPLLYLIRNAKDVGDALRELSQYFHLHASAAEVRLEIEGDHALLHYDVVDIDNLPNLRLAIEIVAGVAMQLMRTLLGSRWQPSALLLQHAPVVEPQSYKRLLGLVPQFNTPFNAWIFDARLLETPLFSADPELHRLIRQHLSTLDQITIRELPTHVQQVLRSLLPNGRVSIEQISQYLMLSPRTLQRYLAEEGTSFQQLLDQTRQAMASSHLRDSAIDLTQLAGILGYADLSAFSRAFHRWFGMSPREWRKQHVPDHSARRKLARQRRRAV